MVHPESTAFRYPTSTADLRLVQNEDRPAYDANPSVITGHHTRMSDEVVDGIMEQFGPEHLGVYTYLERKVNADGRWSASLNQLLDRITIRKSTLIDILNDLEAAGFITVERDPNARQTHRANSYSLPHHYGSEASRMRNQPSPEASTKASPEAGRMRNRQVDTVDTPVDGVDTPLTPQRVQRERFERFWTAFPRKVGKQPAWKAWLKLAPDEAMTDRLLAAVATQRQSHQWTKDNGDYIPHPTTWLNGERWTDELTPATAVPARSNGAYRGKDIGYSNDELIAMAKGRRA